MLSPKRTVLPLLDVGRADRRVGDPQFRASPYAGNRFRNIFQTDVFIAVNSQSFHSAAIVAYRITDGKHRKFWAQVLDTEIAPLAIRGVTFSPRLLS